MLNLNNLYYPVKRLKKFKLGSWFWAIKLLRNGYRGIRLPKRKLWAKMYVKKLILVAEGGMIASPSNPVSGIGAASDRFWSSFDEFRIL